MRVAIFSDVHGNLSALEAVLDHLAARSDVDQIIFAGDLALFGPRPKECCQTIRDQAIPAVVGNTDEWIRQPPLIPLNVADDKRTKLEQRNARCRWTEAQFSAADLAWLDELRKSFQLTISPTDNLRDDLLIVHANPLDLLQIIFPPLEQQQALYGRIRQSDEDLTPMLENVQAKIMAYGHLHIPSIRRWRQLTLVNVSSVSLPGDGDARAKYALFTWSKTNGWTAEHEYVPYDPEPEIVAYQLNQPPGWLDMVNMIQTYGYFPQVV